jgi:hypothetical protein
MKTTMYLYKFDDHKHARLCRTFISIPITEEYNSSTNADINLLQQILRRARRRSGGRGRRWGPELRAPQQWREDTEQWREDLEVAGAAGRPGCAELAVTSQCESIETQNSIKYVLFQA